MATTFSGEQEIEALYVGYFGRAGDPSGVNYWVSQLNAGLSITQIAASFSVQPEATALYGFLASPTGGNSGAITNFVTQVYQDLFNRYPDSSGLAYWTGQLEAANGNPQAVGQFILNVITGAQGFDAFTIQNKVTVAEDFTDSLATANLPYNTGADQIAHSAITDTNSDPGSVPTEESAIANYISSQLNSFVPPQTVLLTTGVDNVSIYADNSTVSGTFNGAGNTFSTGDNISSSAANTTLALTDLGTGGTANVNAAFAGITVSNIQTLVVSSGEGVTIDTSATGLALAELTALHITASNGNDTVTVSNQTAIVLNDTADDDVYANGGSTVTINNNPVSGSYGNYVKVNGGAATTAVTISNGYDDENYIYDLNHGSGTPNTITTVSISNEVDYDTYIYSDALTQLSLSSITYHYVYDFGAAGARTLNIALNNDGNAAGYSSDYWYLESDHATALVFTATGTASTHFYLYAPQATSLIFNDAVDLSFYNGTVAGSGYLAAANATTVTISGVGNFTADLSLINAAAAINAGASSGVLTVELASAGAQTFVGGTGQDIVTIGGTQTGLVTGGSASNNEIILNNVSSATEANIGSSIVSHFSVLGVEGSTSGTFNMSALPAYTSFDVIGSGGNVTFDNVATGSTLSIDNSNSNVITLQTSDTSGASDHVSLVLGSSTSSGITASGVTLEDASGTGIGTVNLVSNGVSGSNAVTLNEMVSTLNLSGAEAISFGTVSHGTTGISVNGSGFDGNVSLALSGATSSGHSDIITLGNGNDTVTDTAAGSGAIVSITLGNGNGVVTVGAQATNTVSFGTGQNTLVEAVGGNVAVSFGAHGSTVVDNVTVGPATSGTIFPSAVITGMNTTGADTITFSGDAGATGAILAFTSTQINGFAGSSTPTLAQAVAGVLAAGGGDLGQHSIGEFQLGNNTYFVEQAGATGSAFAAGDTLVELTGLQTFTVATSAAAGVLSLHG